MSLDVTHLYPEYDQNRGMANKERREKLRLEKEALLNGSSSSWERIRKDYDIIEMRRRVDKRFEKKFHQGYLRYLTGDWAKAEDIFGTCLKIKPSDGPTKTLKTYISDLNGVAPENWKGCRALTSK